MNYTIEELQDKIKTIANLPTLPQVASKLMRIVNLPTTSTDTVASLVAQDVSLSAKVLRLANSAFYGLPKTINSLNSAVIVLGFRIIQTMVLSLTVYDMFDCDDDDGNDAPFNRGEFWEHSLKCAVIARLLAHRRRRNFALDPESAFCAGLLHDVGKVVMEQYLAADFNKALRYSAENGVSSFEAEKNVLGYTHCDVASWLIGSWSLPDEIEQSLVYHHEPEEASICPDAVLTCYIADILSKTSEDNAKVTEAIVGLEQQAVELGLTVKDLADIMEEVPAEAERAAMFINA